MWRRIDWRWCLGLASIAIVAGCAETPPTRFYTLTTPITADPVGGAPPRKPNEVSFAVGPVAVADFLDRPQIVRRVDERQLTVSDFDHWAEPLESLIARTLAEHLADIIGAEDVAILPSQRPLDLDWAVGVDVLRFDADADGRAVAEFRWRLTGASPSDLLRSEKTTSVVASPPGDFDALVAALDGAVADLAREIAAAAPKTPRSEVVPPSSYLPPRTRIAGR